VSLLKKHLAKEIVVVGRYRKTTYGQMQEDYE
jgi:hypothetical protein